MFLNTLINLKAFQVLPMKYAVMLNPLALLGVVFGSSWLFSENICPRAAWGIGLIVAGMLIFSLA